MESSKKQYQAKGTVDNTKHYVKKGSKPKPSTEEGFTGTPD